MNMWANWYMSQWDLYIENNPYARNHPLLHAVEDPMVLFKQPNEKAYARFRELMQLLDISILDILTLQYNQRALVASSMYLLLAYHFGQTTKEQICKEFICSSYFLDAQYPFNDLYSHFLSQSFGFTLHELLPTIQYIATFMSLCFNYELPTVTNNQQVLDVKIKKRQV
jgi:hypothetical protein